MVVTIVSVSVSVPVVIMTIAIAVARAASAYIELGKPLTMESEHQDKNPRLTGRLTVYF